MKNNRFYSNRFAAYILLPVFLSTVIPVFASEPVYISDAEADYDFSSQDDYYNKPKAPYRAEQIAQAPVNSSRIYSEDARVQTEDATYELYDTDGEKLAAHPRNKTRRRPETPAPYVIVAEDLPTVEAAEVLVVKKDEKTIKAENKKLQREKRSMEAPITLNGDYSEYLIPINGYLPVGDAEDKQMRITGSVSKSEQLSLADCLEIAIQNNPKIRAAYAASDAVKELKTQTLSNYAPSISLNSGISRQKPDTSAIKGMNSSAYTRYLLGTISLSQLVYDFGVTQNQYTINKIDWEVSRQNIEAVANVVVYEVKDAYYNLLYAISARQVRAETVNQFQQMYDQARAFYQIGSRPKVDVTIAAANLADAKANYIQATNAVDLAVSKLNNVMGTPFIEPYIVDTSMPYQDTDITMRAAIEIANKARPDLKMAIAQIQKAEEEVKLVKKSYMPQISLGADLSAGGRSDFTDKTWYTVGGYFSFPVINPVSIQSQTKQAKAELEQQKYNTKSSVNDIYYEIQTAYTLVTDARQRIAASKIAVMQARESYELSQGRYKAGVCDAIELKESQVTYENTKLAYISNIYTYNNAKASLEKAIGQSLKPSDVVENVEI